MTESHRYTPRDWALHPPVDSGGPRTPGQPFHPIPHTLSELTGPVFEAAALEPLDADLTRNALTNGECLGERIVVTGRVLDEGEQPIPGALVEIWQANASGRYHHLNDRQDAPLDPNFFGTGRAVTDKQGCYRFATIRPGAYPIGDNRDRWRPTHIHFSIMGPNLLTRLVTQMYFPGDPLLPLDPIYMCVPDDGARERLIGRLSMEASKQEHMLTYEFDIVLRGPRATPEA